MENILFTELTPTEQESLSGGLRRKRLRISQKNVTKVTQKATAISYATGLNSTATATASNYAVVDQSNRAS